MQQSPERQPEIKELFFSGKKMSFKLSSITANLTTNNALRYFQEFRVTVWENDGSGIQINIGVRGLSPKAGN
jgi:Fe(3+) dicitrate transport protein